MSPKKYIHIFIFLALVGFLIFNYSNCVLTSADHLGIWGSTKGTEVLNPMLPSMKIVNSTCQIVRAAHPELSDDQCKSGVLATSFSSALGVPQQTLNPYRTLVQAEQAGVVQADQDEVTQCLSAIGQLDPTLPQVQGAYNPQLFNPFMGVAQMIPGNSSGCPNVYKDSSFPSPTPMPTPDPQTVVVTFDNPLPPSPLDGIYQGIDFSRGELDWTIPFDADSTNFAYNGIETANDLTFTFVGGSKQLLSMNLFMSTASGTITIYDDQGQTVSQFIPNDHAMHVMTTGFAKPSYKIYISGPTSHNLGIDDITYKLPVNPPPITQVQSSLDYGETAAIHSASFDGPNSDGNLIVILVSWDGTTSIQSVQDILGNTYVPALPAATGLEGNKQQIWYAKNIKGGPNTVTVQLAASAYCDFSINEFQGIDKIAPLDVTASAVGIGVTSNSGSVTTHFANELIFGGVYGDGKEFSGWDPAFTVRERTYQNNVTEDMVVTQIGSYSVGLTVGSGSRWIAQIVTFKAAQQ